LATALANRGVSPNAISLAGMVAGIAAGAVFPLTRLADFGWVFFLLGAALMQLRLLANMLDGMVAVQTGKASPVGELYNEVPDRLSDSAILIGAGYAVGAVAELGYVAALFAVLTAYVRAEGKVAGAQQEFCGPMAKPQRMLVLTVAALYCGLAPATWQPALEALPGWGVPAFALLLIAAGSALTAARRLYRIGKTLRRAPQ
jgi:phosphatidylglycerophosphate synthase